MKRPELDNLIRQGNPPHAVMLYGDSHFLIDRYTRVISSVEEANVLSFYFDEYDFNSAKAHLSQGSLFGGQNVLIVKSEKKIPKKELQSFLDLVQKNPDNIFVYAYFGTDYAKSTSSAFTAKSGGVAVRLFPPFPNEARQIVLDEAHKLEIDLDPYAATHLIESQNGNMALTVNELQKLALLQGRVGIKEIDALVYGVGEVKLDDLFAALLEKKPFVPLLQRLLEGGDDEIRILTAFSTHLTQLFLFSCAIKLHGKADSAAVLGYRLPPAVEKARLQQSIRLQQSHYVQLLNLMAETELTMKSSGTKDRYGLLMATLLQVQRLL